MTTSSTPGPKMNESRPETFLSRHRSLLITAGVVAGVAVFCTALVLLGEALKRRGPAKAKGRQADMTVEAYYTQKPKGPHWVKLKASSIQRHSVTADQEHYWVDVGRGAYGKAAWVIKDSPAGKKAYELFKDGLEHDCMACLEWYEGEEPHYRVGHAQILDIE